MRVLAACEFSGVVREAFRKRGHEAFSCDLSPARDNSIHHIEGDVYEHLDKVGKGYYDLLVCHPPCTYLTVAGNRYYADRPDLYEPARDFAVGFLDYAERVCIENPVGRLSTLFRKPDQIIQPYEFGDDASKKTCLWLKNLPPLLVNPDERKPGRIVEHPKGSGRFVERWDNQTDSGQNKLGPSVDRSDLRSVTYGGIANKMAETWG